MRNNHIESVALTASSIAAMGVAAGLGENVQIHGWYDAVCRDADDNILWTERFPNLVTTQGKNDLLDKYLSGSAYTASFFLGLISSVSYSAIVAADTAASHAGWLEAGATNAPTYAAGTRPAASWASASAGTKAFSAGIVFTFTGSGTVKGGFLTTSATKDGTAGVLYSAGLFTGGDQPVVSTNTLTVSYTAGA